MKTVIALLLGGLSTCSSYIDPNTGKVTAYDANGVCGGVELVAINHPGEVARAVLTVWPEGRDVYVDDTPVNNGLQHDVRPFKNPDLVNDWHLVMSRPGGEVLWDSGLRRAMPCD